jgi:hypothetical protein
MHEIADRALALGTFEASEHLWHRRARLCRRWIREEAPQPIRTRARSDRGKERRAFRREPLDDRGRGRMTRRAAELAEQVLTARERGLLSAPGSRERRREDHGEAKENPGRRPARAHRPGPAVRSSPGVVGENTAES